MDAEGPVDKQTSQPSVVETALSTVKVDPTFTPPPSSALRKGLPETAQGCSAQLEPLPSPCQLPRPQKDREGLRGGFSAWTLALDTCTGLAGAVISASTLGHQGHQLAGRGSQYPSLAGQAR